MNSDEVRGTAWIGFDLLAEAQQERVDGSRRGKSSKPQISFSRRSRVITSCGWLRNIFSNETSIGVSG